MRTGAMVCCAGRGTREARGTLSACLRPGDKRQTVQRNHPLAFEARELFPELPQLGFPLRIPAYECLNQQQQGTDDGPQLRRRELFWIEVPEQGKMWQDRKAGRVRGALYLRSSTHATEMAGICFAASSCAASRSTLRATAA